MMNNFPAVYATRLSALCLAGAMSLFSSIASAQTLKVEAETYLSQSGGGVSPVVTENAGASIGYFDEKGETLRYRISVPKAGFYSLSYKYLAGDNSGFLVRTANGAEGLADHKAVVNPNGGWWLTPFASWPVQTSNTLFYLDAGDQDLLLVNQGVGLNLDYFQFTYSPNQSVVVDSLQVSPATIEVKPNHSINIEARATAGANLVAVKWSSNVVGGVYTAGAAGTDSVSVSAGSVSKTVPVTVQMPRAKNQFLVSQHGALRVQTSGEGFVDKNGRLVSLAGPSWFWSDSSRALWTKGMVRYFVQDWKSGMIRLPMSIAPGRFCDGPTNDPATPCYNIAEGDLSRDPKTGERGVTWNKDNYFHNPATSLALMKDMIDEAIENDIYVVVDFHEHHAHKLLPEAKSFFEEIAKLYGQYPNVMFEIFNEPQSYYSWNTIAAYAKEVIPVIRKYSSNPIIVGTRMWSQRVDEVDGQLTGFGNIAYTLHYYAATHGSSLVSKMDLGKPVMITESGNDGPAMWDYINKARAKGISWASWAVNNKGGYDTAWSIFTENNTNFTGPWTDADLTAAGKTQRDIIRGWPRVQDSPIAICNDNTLSSVKFIVNGTTYESGASLVLDQGDSMSIGARGFSSCKDLGLLAVDSTAAIQWSANAPKGVFSVSTLGNYTVTMTNLAPNVSASLNVQVVPPRPFSKKVEAESASPMTGVQLEQTSDVGGGQNVGYIDTGDTLTYSVVIPKAGLYKMSYRVAAETALGMFEVRANQNLTEVVQFNPTGGWQKWTTVNTTVDLPAGTVSLVFKATASGWNINWFQIDAIPVVSSSSVISSSSVTTTSYPSSTSSSSSVPSTSKTSSSTLTSRSSSSSSSSKTSCVVYAIPGSFNLGSTTQIRAEKYCAMNGIQTEPTTDIGGGNNIGWIDAGDSISFVVQQPDEIGSVSYEVSYRVASLSNGGLMQMSRDGVDIGSAVTVPVTGGWQNWQTVTNRIALGSGVDARGIPIPSTITLKFLKGGFNLNWIQFKSVSNNPSSSSSSPVSSSSAPSSKASSSVGDVYCNWQGQRIEVCKNTFDGWSFEAGKTCVSRNVCAAQVPPFGVVNDQTPVSSSSVSIQSSSSAVPPSGVTIQAESYQVMSGVQTESTTDVGGGLSVGWIDAGDWMSYANTGFDVATDGQYLVEFRVASDANGASLIFEEAGGSPAYTTLAVPNTGGWQNWTTVSATVTLKAGTRKFGIAAKSGGWNINWFRVTRLN